MYHRTGYVINLLVKVTSNTCKRKCKIVCSLKDLDTCSTYLDILAESKNFNLIFWIYGMGTKNDKIGNVGFICVHSRQSVHIWWYLALIQLIKISQLQNKVWLNLFFYYMVLCLIKMIFLNSFIRFILNYWIILFYIFIYSMIECS